jgi:hypothetical protein
MVSDSAVLVPSQSAVVTYVAARISAISDNDSAYALITGATFSGAISATNLSGTNTGDQTNITGNAGTVTTINARIAAGANITLTGAGTAASPYSIAATVGSSLTGFTDDSTDFNNALGQGALTGVTSGDHNTATGYNALHALTSGSYNVAMGTLAAAALTSGGANVAVGEEALSITTSGGSNVALGYNALFTNIVGSYNVGIGRSALSGNKADSNIGIGFAAGNNLTTGTGNIIIGTGISASGATASNTLNIGGVITGTGMDVPATSTITIPGALAVTGAASASNLSGTNTGDQNLSAYATLASPTFTGTVAGITAAMVGAPSGSGASSGTNTGDQTNITGNAGTVTTISGQVAAGSGITLTGAGTTGSPYSIAASGGATTLSALTDVSFTGADNTVLFINTTLHSFGLGDQALHSGTATGNYNSSLGYQAGAALTSGANNSLVGTGAGFRLTSGYSNALFGLGAGSNLTSGRNNVLIGENADVDSASSVNRIILGSNIVNTADNTFIVGPLGTKQAILEGSNAAMGIATLSSGTVTVSNTLVTANSRIFYSVQSSSGTVGALSITARTPGSNFTITSLSPTDASTVAWEIKEPA